jgi:hypothetical protein
LAETPGCGGSDQAEAAINSEMVTNSSPRFRRPVMIASSWLSATSRLGSPTSCARMIEPGSTRRTVVVLDGVEH